ncbi:MAG: PilN domain-containing protein [Cognaticolwellia sp.]
MAKHSINLLQADLLPAQAFWTLTRVVGVWFVALVIMLVLIAITQMRLSNVSAELQNQQLQNRQQELQLQNLEMAISNNRNNSALLAQLNTIKLVIANKKHLHQQLTDPKQTYSAGFSSAMTELAQLHDKNIRLQGVNISSGTMTFSGVARKPDAVPNWLSGFESSTFLSGQRFVNFALTENEQKLTEFVVSSAPSKGEQ